MAIIKLIRNTDGGDNYLQNMCKYIDNPSKTLAVGGYGVNPYNKSDVYRQMMNVKSYYGKTSGNPLLHVVVAYNFSVQDAATACRLSELCARYFTDRFQMYYCTHFKDRDSAWYHTHILINSVSYVDGRMADSGYGTLEGFKQYVATVTGQPSRFFYGD